MYKKVFLKKQRFPAGLRVAKRGGGEVRGYRGTSAQKEQNVITITSTVECGEQKTTELR